MHVLSLPLVCCSHTSGKANSAVIAVKVAVVVVSVSVEIQVEGLVMVEKEGIMVVVEAEFLSRMGLRAEKLSVQNSSTTPIAVSFCWIMLKDNPKCKISSWMV